MTIQGSAITETDKLAQICYKMMKNIKRNTLSF